MTSSSAALQNYVRNRNDPTARAAFTDLYGEYNDAPPGWREISEKEFVQGLFFASNSDYRETRQILRPKGGAEWSRVAPATLFFYSDGTGVAMEGDFWAGKIRFYAFGCAHTYRELGQKDCLERNIRYMGGCWHVQECSKCGQIWSYDSSD